MWVSLVLLRVGYFDGFGNFKYLRIRVDGNNFYNFRVILGFLRFFLFEYRYSFTRGDFSVIL